MKFRPSRSMDEEIISSVRDGDVNAFACLVEKYKAVAYSIALKIVKNQEDAEEVVQDAFVNVYKRIHHFQGKAKFSTWFYRIVVNGAISRARLKSLPTSPLSNPEVETANFQTCNDAHDCLQQQERKRYIKAAMQNLDELDYTLLILFYFQEESLKSISTILGRDKNFIKMRLHRARGKLCFELKKQLEKEIDHLL